MAVAYTSIVTISTDNIAVTREFRALSAPTGPLSFDVGRKVQMDLDIQEYTDPFHDPMVPQPSC